MQDPAEHAGRGRLAARTADRDADRRSVEKLSQEFGARHKLGTHAPRRLHVRHRLFDRG